jgi:hypothetical protein
MLYLRGKSKRRVCERKYGELATRRKKENRRRI